MTKIYGRLSSTAYILLLSTVLMSICWKFISNLCSLSGYTLVGIGGKPGGGKTTMVQQCAGLAGVRPHGKASVISVGSYNESSYLEKISHLGGLPTNFEDIHKRKKPTFDQLADGCFSLAGQYTILHKTRRSRGLVFTTTNKECKSNGLNRLDEMSFRRYFLIYTDDQFNISDTSERISLFNKLES